MSEVNADGVLLNPHESILQEVQALTNALTAERPEGLEEDMAAPATAGDGQPAGAAGGAPHIPVAAALAAPARQGGAALEQALADERDRQAAARLTTPQIAQKLDLGRLARFFGGGAFRRGRGAPPGARGISLMNSLFAGRAP